jgi:glutamyl-tRNA reductase
LFDKLADTLVDADVVFCCTSAPHFLLTKQLLSPLIASRRNQNDLLIIDISNPRNVEQHSREIPHVKLYDIDDLTAMAENNKQEREKIMWEAFRVVDRELEALECAINADSVNEIVAEVSRKLKKTAAGNFPRLLA